MNWIKSTEYYDTYSCTEYFNEYKYTILIWVEKSHKSVKYWMGVSSGKKRRELEIFEEKEDKSLGGIEALLWVRNCFFDFPLFYAPYVKGRKEYLCVSWADTRRKNIYKRLEKYGFRFMVDQGQEVLIKKL